MSLNNTQIGFIGGGHMAQAMIRGLLHAGHSAELISVSDPDAAQRTQLQAIDPELVIANLSD